MYLSVYKKKNHQSFHQKNNRDRRAASARVPDLISRAAAAAAPVVGEMMYLPIDLMYMFTNEQKAYIQHICTEDIETYR